MCCRSGCSVRMGGVIGGVVDIRWWLSGCSWPVVLSGLSIQ